MNQREAMRETLALVKSRVQLWYDSIPPATCEEVGLYHFEDMLTKVDDTKNFFSEAKLGRWLGWIQGAAAARGLLTLEEAKKINFKWKG